MIILRDPDPAGDGNGGGGDVSTEINLGSEGNAVPATLTHESAIPADVIPVDFREKGYMKGVENFEQLFKKLDGSQTLVGERAIPGEGATDEDWDKYYKSTGKPESADKYEFNTETKLPEGTERNPELEGKFKELMHRAGISQKQAGVLSKGYDELMVGVLNAKAEADKQADINFDALGDKVFKDQKTAVLERSKQLIDAHIPEEMKEALSTLPNESLIIMAGVLEGVRAKYINEDAPGGGAPTGGAVNMEERRAEARTLMNSEAYTNQFHKDHETTKAKVNELYAPLRKK